MEILKFEDAPKRSSVKRGKNSSRKTILGVAAAAAIAEVANPSIERRKIVVPLSLMVRETTAAI